MTPDQSESHNQLPGSLSMNVICHQAYIVTVGVHNRVGRAINCVGVFCREGVFHNLALVAALTPTIAHLRLN